MIKVDYPLFALLMPWRGYVPDAQIIIAPPGRQLPAPQASARRPIRCLTRSNERPSLRDPADAVDREHEYWTELTLQLLNDIQGKNGGGMTNIPHYRKSQARSQKRLLEFWAVGGRYRCLDRAGAIDKKWGAKTSFLSGRKIDTLIAAVESGEVGITPPPRVGADDKKKTLKQL